jgi:hypothetical protein
LQMQGHIELHQLRQLGDIRHNPPRQDY